MASKRELERRVAVLEFELALLRGREAARLACAPVRPSQVTPWGSPLVW